MIGDLRILKSNFGLVRSDGSRRPAFLAVKRLIEATKDNARDSGAKGRSGNLTVTIEGDVRDVKMVALSRADGSVIVPIWLGVSSWDPGLRQEIPVAPHSLKLSFSAGLKPVAIRSLDTDNAQTVTPQASGQLEIKVSDVVQFIELR